MKLHLLISLSPTRIRLVMDSVSSSQFENAAAKHLQQVTTKGAPKTAEGQVGYSMYQALSGLGKLIINLT